MTKCAFLILWAMNLILLHQQRSIADSCLTKMKDTIIVKNKGQLYVSTSFKQLTNHHNDNGFNLNLSTKLNLSRTKTGNSSRSKQELNSELSFTKYIDSIIVVYDDEIEYTGNWEYQSLSILNTINLKIKSQFTNSYNYKYQSNGFNKVLSKKLFSPTLFSLGTGFNFKFDTFKIGRAHV